MTKNMHDYEFANHTKHKLDLYGDYLISALPVFISTPGINVINLVDFFCGPGTDRVGQSGSPLRAIEAIQKHAQTTGFSSKKINLIFNDTDSKKIESLEQSLSNITLPVNVQVFYCNDPFSQLFEEMYDYMNRKDIANILFIDQYGISEVSEEIFGKLTYLSYTDFIFFLSSNTGYRFSEDENVLSKLPPMTSKERESVKTRKGRTIHRVLANAYYRWVPGGNVVYLASFSLLHEGNIYGLVFGSRSLVGLEKFLREAWKKYPEHAGQADYDIDRNRIVPRQMTLFEDANKPSKLLWFEQRLEEKILAKELLDNYAVYRYTLVNGMLPDHARDVLKKMRAEKKILKTVPVSKDAMKKTRVQIEIRSLP